MSDPGADIYRPLPETDEIRLLRLHRADSEHISGTLETYSLENVPEFYALSYTWGPPRTNHRILIDGKPLRITQSLASALNQLSTPGGILQPLQSTYIWIDQICINQTDHGEKRHQVTLMGPIYSKAVRTIIWLGEDKNNIAESAFALCRHVEALFKRERVIDPELGLDVIAFRHLQLSDFKEYDLPNQGDRRWNDLNSLFRNRWWGRVWVQQEAILSQEDPWLLLGSSLCSFETVGRAYSWFAAHDFHFDNIVVRQASNIGVLFSTRTMRSRGVDEHLGSLIKMSSRQTAATDPRDKVYGLLGVARGGLEKDSATGSRVRVARSSECTAQQVYRDAARHVILTTKNLAILSGPKLRTKHIRDRYRSFGRQCKWAPCSSWIPSFDAGFYPSTNFAVAQLSTDGPPPRDSDRRLYVLNWLQHCSAAKRLPVQIEHPCRDPDVLRIRGIEAGHVHCIQEINTSIATGMQMWGPIDYFRREGTVEHDAAYMRYCLKLWGLPASRFFTQTAATGMKRPGFARLWESALDYTDRTPEDLATVVFMILSSGGRDGRPYSPQVLEAFFMYLSHYYQNIAGGGDYSLLRAKGQGGAIEFLKRWEADETWDLEQFTQWLFLAIEGWTTLRRFFLTKEGRLGLGPPAMRPGDSLCVMFGGGVVFIMRRKDDHWLLVGEAYVEGYMSGEVVDDWEVGKRTADWFDIH